jgi:hypothetical protein
MRRGFLQALQALFRAPRTLWLSGYRLLRAERFATLVVSRSIHRKTWPQARKPCRDGALDALELWVRVSGNASGTPWFRTPADTRLPRMYGFLTSLIREARFTYAHHGGCHVR